MDIARASIEKPVNTWLIILICLLGGIWGLLTLGRLEDPDFTIKEAIITTAYPGASALEVEQEVTDQLETAIQRLPQVKEVRSRSTPGMSQITVEMESHYNNETLPQVWDELRRKVNDVQALLPPGAQPSIVNDDFGDVFGLYYALTAPDYPQADLARLRPYPAAEIVAGARRRQGRVERLAGRAYLRGDPAGGHDASGHPANHHRQRPGRAEPGGGQRRDAGG